MSNRNVLYRNEQHMFTVSEENGRLLLEVLCGGSGMFTEEHWLNDDEIEVFRSNPEDLKELASSLCAKPFGNRK